MTQLMNELVGRSIASEREHDLAVRLRLRGDGEQRATPRPRRRPPRHRTGRSPVAAPA